MEMAKLKKGSFPKSARTGFIAGKTKSGHAYKIRVPSKGK